jgi:periplasmic divalent cation tolerance protein
VKVGGQGRIVLITCGKLAEARQIAQSVVQKRLAACVNIVPGPVESVYRWKNRVAKAREWLLVMKTTRKQLRALEEEVKRLHSYDVPEFITLRISGGSQDYLAWLAESV